MRRIPTPALVLLVLALAAVPTTAAAQTDPPTTTEWQDPTLVITAASPGTPVLTDAPGTPHDGPRYYCGWFSLDVGSVDITASHVAHPTIGDTYVFICWFTHPWVDPYPGYPLIAVFDPTTDPPGPLVTTPEVARFALASIDFEHPAIATSPATTHVVGIPSWFAVESELDYATASAQAGAVWATVRPVFHDVEWIFGNGERLVCAHDATTQWQRDGPLTQRSECHHTFASTTDGSPRPAVMPTSATVRWTVWQRTDRTAGAWQQWGTVSLTTTVDLPLVDLQAAIN